jgi:PEP-CTERM motif
MWCYKKILFVILQLPLWCSIAQGSTIQLITNGHFEAGNLSGWTTYSTTQNNGFSADITGSTTPISGHATPEALVNGGQYYAVADQNRTSTAALIQSFTVDALHTSLILSFNWFDTTYRNYSGSALNNSTQTERIDILTGIANPFDTGSGVVQSLNLNGGLYSTTNTPDSWRFASIDLTGLAAGTYQLRFAETAYSYYNIMGVDNVSLLETLGTVPEPTSIALLVTGLIALLAFRKKSLTFTNVSR